MTWEYRTPGIPDERFTRGKIPMTKQEIRILTLAKACLCQNSVVYDIGAGTGSLTVEAALLADRGKVYAIEREGEGVKLIKENCRQFAVENVQIIQGEAPAAMRGLPRADRVFIGGSGGKLTAIITEAAGNMTPGGRIVINAVTMETLNTAQRCLEEYDFSQIEIISAAVTRWPKIGRNHMAQALNPVFIVSAVLGSDLNC